MASIEPASGGSPSSDPGAVALPGLSNQAEKRLAAALQCSPDAILISALRNGALIEVNGAGSRFLGYSRLELLGHANGDLHYWLDPADEERYLARLRIDGHVSEMEAAFRTKTGEIRLGLISGEPIDLPDHPQVLSVIRDITESRRADKELRDSRERLLKAQRVARVGFLDWDLRTNEIFLSDEACALVGVKAGGGLLTPDFMATSVHPDDLAYTGANLDLAIRGLKPYDIVHRHVRPEWRHRLGPRAGGALAGCERRPEHAARHHR
jgi:PAS domain S-box-containing protein